MKKLALAAALLLLLTPASWGKAYVGASLGQSDATTGGTSDQTSWKVLGGYEFMKYAGVEGSYRNMGSYDQTIGTTSFGVDAKSMDVFGVGRYPIGEKFAVFAKAGYAFIDVKASVYDPQFGSISGSSSENEFAYGAGVSWDVGEKISIRAEYETFDVVENADMISAGGVFRF